MGESGCLLLSGQTLQTQGGFLDACCPPSAFIIRCPAVNDPKPLDSPRGIQLHGLAGEASPTLHFQTFFSFVFTLYLLWDISEINPFPVQLRLGSKSYPETTNTNPRPTLPAVPEANQSRLNFWSHENYITILETTRQVCCQG